MKKYLLILALFASLSAFAEEVTTNLVVWAKDGSKVAYALAEKPNVTFTETDMVIKTEKVEVNYSLSQMARITYEKSDVSMDIIGLDGEKINPFDFSGESLIFPASKENVKVAVFAADGKTVLNREVRKGDVLTVSLASFRTGIYMINVNGVTYKIVVR